MPEHLRDLPELATRLAAETATPPFERIVVRARRRRRRQALGVTTAATALVAAVAAGTLLTSGRDTTTPQPSNPSGTPTGAPTGTPTASAVDAARIVLSGGLVSYAVGPDASQLTIWQLCADDADQAGCHAAWQLRTTEDLFQGLVHGDTPVAHAAGSEFVVSTWNKGAVVLDLSGRQRPVTTVDHGAVTFGDVIVTRGKGLEVVDPGTATAWSLGGAPDGGTMVQGDVAADGSTWAMSLAPGPSAGAVLWHRGRDESTWQRHVLPGDHAQDALPGYLAVGGDHVAALSGYDGATVLPVADLAVTADGGKTWTDLHQGDLPFTYVDAMAATSDGTLYVVTPGGEHLFRSTDDTWTHFAEVPNPGAADQLVPAGDRVIARGGSFTAPALTAFDRDGRSTLVTLDR